MTDKTADQSGLIVPHDATSKAFVEGLVARGEAVQVAPDTPLPPGATHEIVGTTADGLPILKRKRMSMF